jgi:carboxyl-terminal processing protease
VNKKRIFVLLALVFIVASTGMLIGRWSIGAEGEGYEDLKVFTEALTMVKKNYVEEVKTRDLVYGAIKGMLSSLDPHSSFLNPDAYKEMQAETRGEFGGIGIQIGVKEGMLTVIAPIEDTPAYRAGIKAGDKIIKINNEATRNMSLQ